MTARLLRFFGYTLFFGVGGLLSSCVILMLEHSALILAWGWICATWTVLGVIGRIGYLHG